MLVPSLGSPAPSVRANSEHAIEPSKPPLPNRLSVMPARSIRPNGRVKPGSAGAPLTGPENGTPPGLLPPTATNAMYSAIWVKSGFLPFVRTSGVLSGEFSSVANPVVPGKKTADAADLHRPFL